MYKIAYIDTPSFMPKQFVNRMDALGGLKVYMDKPTQEELVNRLNSFDIAIVEWSNLTRQVLEKSSVRYITLVTTSYSNVDVVAARERGISVSNCPQYARQSVAEYAFGLLFQLCRKINQSANAARTGNPVPFEPYVGLELYNKTLGVVGLGDIGSWIARIGLGFGMRVIGTSRTHKNLTGVEELPLEDVLQQSDILMLTVDLNPSTRPLLTRDRMELIRQDAYLINIANNAILDEKALADLLTRGRIKGAGMDVVKNISGNPLLGFDNVIITPSMAWNTQSAIDRNLNIVADNIEAFIKGAPINLVT